MKLTWNKYLQSLPAVELKSTFFVCWRQRGDGVAFQLSLNKFWLPVRPHWTADISGEQPPDKAAVLLVRGLSIPKCAGLLRPNWAELLWPNWAGLLNPPANSCLGVFALDAKVMALIDTAMISGGLFVLNESGEREITFRIRILD